MRLTQVTYDETGMPDYDSATDRIDNRSTTRTRRGARDAWGEGWPIRRTRIGR